MTDKSNKNKKVQQNIKEQVHKVEYDLWPLIEGYRRAIGKPTTRRSVVNCINHI